MSHYTPEDTERLVAIFGDAIAEAVYNHVGNTESADQHRSWEEIRAEATGPAYEEFTEFGRVAAAAVMPIVDSMMGTTKQATVAAMMELRSSEHQLEEPILETAEEPAGEPAT